MKSLQDIEQDIRTCTRCEFYRTRTEPVIGHFGSSNELVFVGETPGVIDNSIGKPLMGEDGKLLNQYINKYFGLIREQFNILLCTRCMPIRNSKRTYPTEASVFWCAEWLYEQLHLIKPKFIVTLGSLPMHMFINREGFKFAAKQDIEEGDRVKDKMGQVFRTKSLLYNEWFLVTPLTHPGSWKTPAKLSFEDLNKYIKRASDMFNDIRRNIDFEDLSRCYNNLQQNS
jgi:uracil-DNA glycosylase family 4